MSEALIKFIDRHGGKRLPPSTHEQIEDAENKLGLKLPDQLREFYLRCGGSDTFTDTMWHIWPVDEFVTLASKIAPNFEVYWSQERRDPFDPSRYLVFADSMIELPNYAICADPKSPHYGEIITEGGGDTIGGPIKSFEMFVQILEKHWEFGLLPDSLE